jgi:hypothetical protein
MSENEYVRLAEYDSETEATLAQAVLEENGIHATIAGLEPSALGLSLDGELIEIFVASSDVSQAQSLLENLAGADQEDDIPAWTCACGETVDEGFFVCWSCGAEYKKAES